MEGNGEGMVAVVHGLRDAGLAVTLMSRRCASQGRKMAKIIAMKNHSLPQTKSSVDTNTDNSYDMMKNNVGVQICDDRYASSYQLAHCRKNPTSPPISLSEFPPQRSQPNRTQGNFEIGSFARGEDSYEPIRPQYSFRSSLRWSERRSVQFSRASCQTDPFAHSLRRYPSLPPSRSISADLIERLLKHTQAKNFVKPSKTSKSMRSIPKDKSDEQTNKRERKSKNIQTYTRTRKEDRVDENNSHNMRKERNYRLSFSGDRRHKKNKDNHVSSTYDYLKGNSSLYRKRHDCYTDVRYLDNLTKYIKDTLQQICDDRPVICPNIQSRYDQHRRTYHNDHPSHESNDADDQAAPSRYQASPPSSIQLSPGTCRKDCPKGRKICNLCGKPLACPCVKTPQTEAATSSPSLPMASKFCQCLPDDIASGKRKRSNDEDTCLCSSDTEKSGLYDQNVDGQVLAWIRELPVKAGDTAENVAARERMGRELADVLKNIPQDGNYDDNVMNTVKKYLDKLPIWLPDNKAAQDAFKDLMARNLLNKLKELPDKLDEFADVIKKWVKDIDFKRAVDEDNIAGDFINKLRPIALNRPKSNYDYAQILNDIINDMLDALPIDTKGDKQKTLNELAEKLVKELVSLAELAKKLDRFADTNKEWVNDIKFKRDLNKDKVADDFTNKLRPLASNGPESNYEYAEKLKDTIKNKLRKQSLDIKGEKELGELADNLTNKLARLSKDAGKPEVMVKSLNEFVDIINGWLDEDFPFMKDSKAVEDLAKKLRDLQAKGADENEMRNVIQDFLRNVLDITDPEILERLTNKLLRQFLGDNVKAKPTTPTKNREEDVNKIYQDVYNWMKNRLEISHLSPDKIKELCRELANEIYDNKIAGGEEINMSEWLKRKLSDIGEGNTAQEDRRRRTLVLNEVDKFLANAVSDLPPDMKEELKDKLADMLIKNVDEIINYEVEDELLEDETDRLIDKLFDGVKNIYAPDQTNIKVEIPKETEKTLMEEIGSVLDIASADVKDKDALKANLINLLVDGIRRGENENELRQEVYDQLRAANLSEEEAKKIAQSLLEKAKDMTLGLISQDSKMAHKKRLSKAEPSKFRNSINYQLEDNIFVPDDVIKIDKKRKSSSLSGIAKLKSAKDEPMSQELLEQLKAYNIDPNDKKAVERLKEALQASKQGKGSLDKVMASLERYSNLPKVPRKDKSNGSATEYSPSLASSYSGIKKELIESSVCGDEDARSKVPIKTEPDEKVRQLTEERIKKLDRVDDTDKVKKKKDRLDSKTKQAIKKSLKGGIQDILHDANINVDDREDLESKLNSLLNKLATGEVDDVSKDVYKLLRDANIPDKQARAISKKLLDKTQDISDASTQKAKAGPSKSRPLDSKTKQEIKKSLKGGIVNILDDANIDVDDREELEANLNNLLNQLATGEVDDVSDDVYKLLRNANVPDKQARAITNKLLDKVQDVSKAAAGPLRGRQMDPKTKQEIKKILKGGIQNILDDANIDVEDREELKANLNNLLNQLATGEVDDVTDDVYKLLRNANVPDKQARAITNKLLDKAQNVSKAAAQKAGPSRGRQMDTKTKQEIKKSLKGGIQDILDAANIDVDDRQDLEAKLNNLLNQLATNEVDDVSDDVYKLLRNANVPEKQARAITNKLLNKTQDISKAAAGPSRGRQMDPKTKQEIKKTLKGGIQNILNDANIDVDDREELEANLNNLLNQLATGEVDDVTDDVYNMLRNANVPEKQARAITNKLLDKAQDISKAAAGSSRGRQMDPKTKQEIKKTLKGGIQNILNDANIDVDDREELEANLNNLLNQLATGEVDDVTDDVYKLLRNANVPDKQARAITNKLLDKAQNVSKAAAQKPGPLRGRQMDPKTKQEIKKTLKGGIQNILDDANIDVDDREELEANLNNLLNQLATGEVNDVTDDVYKLLRNANLPEKQARAITNKLLDKAQDVSKAAAQKAGPSRGRQMDFKTKQEIKKSLRGGIQGILDDSNVDVDDRQDLEAKLNNLLNQLATGEVDDVSDDVYKLLRNANVPDKQARAITNKLLDKTQDISKAAAGPSRARQMDSKTQQEIKQSLKRNIQKVLDKVKSKIDDRSDLESKLLKTILHQIEIGDMEDIRDDVYKLLRNANISAEEAKNLANKLLGTAKELSETLSQKTQGKPLDSKTKEEIKQSMKSDIHKALDKVKSKIDDRENLESNLLNTVLDKVHGGNVEDIRDDIYKLLRNANIPAEEARNITNKLIGKGKDLSEAVQLMKSRSSTGDEDTIDNLKSGKAYAQKPRPEGDKKGRISSKEKHALREAIIGDVNDLVDGAPLPLSPRTKNVLKSKLSSALIKGLDEPFDKEEVKNKMLNILSEESIKLQNGKTKTFDKAGQKGGKRRDSTGRIKLVQESILHEITNALDDAPTKIPKSKRNNLRKILADIIMANIKSDINEIRIKILNILTKETHLHKGVINDLSSDIIERIIYVIKECELANRRKSKKLIYSLHIEGKKRAGKRKKDGNASSDEDGPMTRSKSTIKHDFSNYSNLSKSISEHVDSTIAKEHIIIPQYKISEIKQKLENLSPKDIVAMIRGDKAIKDKILGVLINEIKVKDNAATELINGVIKRFNEADDSQYSASSSQMQDMKGYLKGEILGLLEKYNIKFNQKINIKPGATSPSIKSPSSSVKSTSPSVKSDAPLSSTPRDDIESPQMLTQPSLSTVYDDDETSENTLKPSDRINSAEYFNRMNDIVNNWIDELPVDLTDDTYRETMVKDLAADIIERQKYLQLNPDAKTSVKEELECLKYQVFRWLNNVVDIGDLTPMTPKIEELRDRINDIDKPLFNKSSKRHRGKTTSATAQSNNIANDNSSIVGKERTSDAFVNKFEDWVDSLPTKFKNEEEKQQYENLKSELFSRLKDLGPNASPQAIQNEINKFLRKAPLDPSKQIDMDDKIDELTRIVQTTEPSKMEAASFESKTGYKKLPNLLYDFIEKWCDSLPFDENLDQDTIKNMKHSLANKILQKICQLNLNPEILNDDFLYEDVLRDEIDNLLSEIRQYLPVDDDQLAEFKDVLVNKIKEAKQKTQNELAGQMYKQQLKDTISRALPPGLDLTSEDQTSLEVLKDAVADAFINLNYSGNDEELRNRLKRKIADEVTRFCNNYLQRHPSAPLCSNKLNQDLYAALKNVSQPHDESMRAEVEHVRMKDVITDWVKGLPLAEQTPTGQSTLNKMISILAKRLHDLERAGELNDSDYTEEIKKEIKKWLRKLPLLGGKDAIDHYAADLIDRLKNTEDSRKFDASTRLQRDSTEICPEPCHYSIKEKPKPPKPCPDTCMHTPQFPSTLTIEDREHLDRIRERVQQARSKLAQRPCRDASPSPCMDTGSQTDIRPFGSMKSIPSVCPGPYQRAYKSAASRLRESPSCHIAGGTARSEKSTCPGMYASPQGRRGRRRSDGASPCMESFSPCPGSYSEVQPQIIVKEYYWDSTANSNHQIPCRSPCDTYQGSHDPRSPCSQPSPTCRGQYAQPHTTPQSPLISSSDQENRRPRPEPSTSRCYKERVTRLGSLDDMRGPNVKNKQSENFDWNSVRFPEDDDFWGPCQRPIILSDDDFGPFSRERERKEERVRCRCRERVLTKCATKRRSRFCGSCSSCNNDPTKRCTKCSAVQCPHPSYLYFRK